MEGDGSGEGTACQPSLPSATENTRPRPPCVAGTHLQLGSGVDEQVVHIGQRRLQRLQAVVPAAAPLAA